MAGDGPLEPNVQAGALVRQAAAEVDARLEERLGHVFNDKSLLSRALTHVSALGGEAARAQSYQRLEFLGDRVLGLVVAEMLLKAFPEEEEGEMSRRLAEMVRRESCAEVALEWGVGPHVRLGIGEAQSGGAGKGAILADICEAIIGAVFLDAGYASARALVAGAWRGRMNAPRRPLRDAKTLLQEWAQGRGLPAPAYRESARSGPAHAPHFVMAVHVEGFTPAQAEGGSKRAAEQAAAVEFLRREGLAGRLGE